jgi:LysM repeat protein
MSDYKMGFSMPRTRHWILFLSVLLALSFAGIASIEAQDGNLLRDPGFETSSYKGIAEGPDGTTFNVPGDWGGWLTQTPRTQDWMNLVPNGFPHTGSMKRSGTKSFNVGRGGATFTMAIYQQVTVNPESDLRATAWVLQDNSSASNARVRIGIDPNGGTNPLGSGIVWSGSYSTVGSWIEMSVDATSIAGTVTVFIYATQAWPNDPNDIYIDDAALVVGGEGGTAPDAESTTAAVPAPTSIPVVPFVSAQGAREDGSIVHTVGSGDTIDSIAVAYGVTRNEILELNHLDKSSYLQIGQKLIIKPANTDASAEETETVEAPTTDTAATPGPEVTEVSAPASEETAEVPEVPTETVPQPTPVVQSSNVNPEDVPPAPVVAAASGRSNPAETSASVCVLFYHDANANRIQEDGEALLAGGKVTLNTSDATLSEYETDGVSEPSCFADLTPGDYVVAASAPEGYGLTTPAQLHLRVQPGIRLDIAFGAGMGVDVVAPPPVDSDQTVINEPVDTQPESTSTTNGLAGISGLLVFGLAAIVFVGGLGATFLLLRRKA